MAVFFNGASSFSPVSLHGLIQTGQNGNLELVRDIVRYQLLYDNMLNRLRQYINLYTDGSYNELKTVFTTSSVNLILASNNDFVYYNSDVDNLVDFTYDSNTFNNYKRSMYSMMTGFTTAIKQNDDLVSTTLELNDKKDLLSSKDKLIEYITKEFLDKISIDAFSISQPFNTRAVLKPWYNLYLQLYGAPYDGIFNAEKMANVVEILVNKNIIEIDDFVNNYA
jgi:hypothetical protein